MSIRAVYKSPCRRTDEIVFLIQFCGKTVGELGVPDNDLACLDWNQFKSYLSHNFPIIPFDDDLDVSYSDEEGDQVPIGSDSEYREAVKIAKWKAKKSDKLLLKVNKPRNLNLISDNPLTSSSVLSLVSSIKRVGTSPPKEGIICSGLTEIKDSMWAGVPETKKMPVTNLDHNKASRPARNWPLEVGKPAGDGSNDSGNSSNGSSYHLPKHVVQKEVEDHPPQWFINYMDKFKISLERDMNKQHNELMRYFINQHKKIGSALKTIGKHYELINKMRNDQLLYFKNHQCTATAPVVHDKCTLKRKSLRMDDDEDNAVLRCKLAREEKTNREKLLHRFKRKEEKIMRKIQKEEEKLRQRMAKSENKFKGKLTQEKESSRKRSERNERKAVPYRLHDVHNGGDNIHNKLMARIEGFKKRQSCTTDEVNKLRKMIDKVDKKCKVMGGDSINSKRCGKYRRFSIDTKSAPVSPDLLAQALADLEALAEEKSDAITDGYDAKFIRDVTYPDGSKVLPGEEFIKVWRVSNSGTVHWNDKTLLCKWSQVRFLGSPFSWKLQPKIRKVHCPYLLPNEQGDISVTFIAPKEPGWYATHWRFCQKGKVFGNQMWCTVEVVSPFEDSEVAKSDDIMRLMQTLRNPESVLTAYDDSEEDSDKEELLANLTESDQAGKMNASISCLKNTLSETTTQEAIASDRDTPYQSADESEYERAAVWDGNELINKKFYVEDINKLILDINNDQHASGEGKLPMPSTQHETNCAAVDLKEPNIVTDLASDKVATTSQEKPLDDESVVQKVIEDKKEATLFSSHCDELANDDEEDDNDDSDSSDDDQSDNDDFVNVSLIDQLQKQNLAAFELNPTEKFCIVKQDDVGEETLSQPEGHGITDFEVVEILNEESKTEEVLAEAMTDSAVGVDNCEAIIEDFDTFSMSSRTYSELDSEDEAILNESESDISSSDYCQIELPQCFNLDTEDIIPVLGDLKLTDAAEAADDCEEIEKEQIKEESATCQNIPLDLSLNKAPDTVKRLTKEDKSVGTEETRTFPEEVVSVIPEDLIHGAWNTARSFINTINKGLGNESSSDAGPSEMNKPVSSTASDNPPVAAKDAGSPVLSPELKQLEDMGFTDREHNHKLLVKHQNDVSKAVAELLILHQ